MTFTLKEGGRPTIDKRADASLRYGIDVSDVLAAGDTVATVEATVSAGSKSDVQAAGALLSARVAGGTPGQTIALKFTWTTAQGDTDSRTVYLSVVAA